MIKDLLSKLGATTRITVGVSVSPGLGVEMIEVDPSTMTINKYGCKPLDYNYSTREIADYDQFQMVLGDLFDELKIPRKSNVILNMPSVHFGIINLPLLLTDEAITNAIISEVEQSYIFKRHEPVASWCEIGSNMDTESRVLAYTAIQQTALDALMAACQEVGCTLAAVENSYASLLKSLDFANLAQDQMKENMTWNLMVVGQNNYSIFSMMGKRLIDFYEEPLALKSFVDDEIYNAITTSAQVTLAGLPANSLYIVSETDLVSAEVLSMKMPFEGNISFLECNKYTQNELMTVNLNILPNLALKITPEAIASAIYHTSNYPLKFNLTGEKDVTSADSLVAETYPRVNIGNVEVELTPDFMKKISLIFGAILIIPALIILIALNSFTGKEQLKLDDLNAKIKTTTDEISKYNNSSDAFDLNATISKIITQNKTKMVYFSALGMSIPNKLWVTYYATNENGGVDIKGKASNVESVYAFYKNMKQLVNNADIKLYKLEIEAASLENMLKNENGGPKYYSFEITNMSASELAAAPGGQTQPGAPGQSGAPTQPTQPGAPQPAPSPNPTPSPSPNPAGAISPPPGSPASPSGEQLPKNLEKIEKF